MNGSIFYESSNARAGAHNPKTPRFALFLISIRDSVLALPSADRDCARIDAHGESPRLSARTPFSQPFAMSGQLASAVTSVRIFFSRCIGGFQNSPREHRQWVPIIAVASAEAFLNEMDAEDLK